MRLYASGCGCISEGDARLMSKCDRASHGLNAASAGLRLVPRAVLVAQVEAWIAVAPSTCAMLERLDAATRTSGITGAELRAAQTARTGL